MITKRSTKAQLFAELDRVTAALMRSDEKRGCHFEEAHLWRKRCIAAEGKALGLQAQLDALTGVSAIQRAVAASGMRSMTPEEREAHNQFIVSKFVPTK